MRTMRLILLWWLSIGVCFAEVEESQTFTEVPAVKEQTLELPKYPLPADLVYFEVKTTRFKYALDTRSLSVGKKDQIARYTVVIESPQGAKTVLYEGIRCDSRDYKTYAHAGPDQKFHVKQKPEWESIRSEGAFVYRAELLDYYLCQGAVVRYKVREILQVLRYPAARHTPDE